MTDKTDQTLSGPLLLVGCGKMGGAMLSGWLASGVCQGGVHIIEPLGAPEFENAEGVTLHAGPETLPETMEPDFIVLAVKPQLMAAVIGAYQRFAHGRTCFLSIAAGTTIGFFEDALGATASIVRAMPNTPAAIGQGITVLCPNDACSEAQAKTAAMLLQAVGETVLVEDEALMDAVTAVSGSGPAYVFLLIETLAEAGVAAGLPPDLSARLALTTVAGAGALAEHEAETAPATLRENVTSPNGTTHAALQVLMREKDGMADLMRAAVAAATNRSRELAGG